MNRALTLVALDWTRAKDPRTSLGHASLLARLGEVRGLSVTSVCAQVNSPNFRREDVLGAILVGGAPDDVAVGVYVWNEAVVQWLLPALRRAGFTGRILLGGPQISYAPVGIDATYPDADIFIRGYGEDALAAVAGTDHSVDLPGVSWRGRDLSERPASVDLGGLPSPFLGGVLPSSPFVRWETQRGCVYACSFCQHRESGVRLRQTVLAPGRITREIDHFVATGVRDIAVLDPIFHTNPAAVGILHRFRDRGYAGRLSLQARFELVDDTFLDACGGLDVRLEFGLQTVHLAEMRAIGRRNDLGKGTAVIEALHSRGIPFEVSLIYGLPTQTASSFRESVAWCRERAVPVLRAFPLMLLRGTGLDRDRARWGLVENDEAIPLVVASSTFSVVEWKTMQALADSLEVGEGGGVGGEGFAPPLQRYSGSPRGVLAGRPVSTSGVGLRTTGGRA